MKRCSISSLNKEIDIKIDRQINSKHPKHDIIYEVNYGYIPNTVSGDGEEIDVYVLGVEEPIENIRGKVVAIIHRLNDNEDKLVACPLNFSKKYSKEEIKKLTNFQEKYFKSEIIM